MDRKKKADGQAKDADKQCLSLQAEKKAASQAKKRNRLGRGKAGRPRKLSPEELRRGVEAYFASISYLEPVTREEDIILDTDPKTGGVTFLLDKMGHRMKRVVPVTGANGKPLMRTVYVEAPGDFGLCNFLKISRDTWERYGRAVELLEARREQGTGSRGLAEDGGRPVQARSAPRAQWALAERAGGVSGPMWSSAPTEAQAMPLGGFAPTGEDSRTDSSASLHSAQTPKQCGGVQSNDRMGEGSEGRDAPHLSAAPTPVLEDASCVSPAAALAIKHKTVPRTVLSPEGEGFGGRPVTAPTGEDPEMEEAREYAEIYTLARGRVCAYLESAAETRGGKGAVFKLERMYGLSEKKEVTVSAGGSVEEYLRKIGGETEF